MSYRINVLEDKEFDALPYSHVKTALGCADPKTKTAYVRNTRWGEISKAVNLLTIQHELDELVAKTSPHEIDGIRYKGTSSGQGGFFKNLWEAINPATGNNINNSGQGTSRQGTGSGGVASQGGWGIGSPVGGGGPNRGTTVTGSLGASNTASRSTTTGGSSRLLGAFNNYQNSTLGFANTPLSLGSRSFNTSPNLSSINQPTSTSYYANRGSNYNAGIDSLLSSAMSQTDSSTQSSSTNTPTTSGNTIMGGLTNAVKGIPKLTGDALSSFLNNPQAMLGAASLAVSAFTPSTKPQELGPTISKWLTADTVTNAGKIAKGIADVEYTGDFQTSKETQAYIEAMGKDITKAYAQRKKDIDKMASVTNANWMQSGERLSLYQRMAADEQREIDTMQAEWINNAKTTYATQKYNYVIGQLAVDNQTKKDLLTGEIYDIMNKYNIKQADLLNFRKLAADAGMYLLKGGSTPATPAA